MATNTDGERLPLQDTRLDTGKGSTCGLGRGQRSGEFGRNRARKWQLSVRKSRALGVLVLHFLVCSFAAFPGFQACWPSAVYAQIFRHTHLYT